MAGLACAPSFGSGQPGVYTVEGSGASLTGRLDRPQGQPRASGPPGGGRAPCAHARSAGEGLVRVGTRHRSRRDAGAALRCSELQRATAYSRRDSRTRSRPANIHWGSVREIWIIPV